MRNNGASNIEIQSLGAVIPDQLAEETKYAHAQLKEALEFMPPSEAKGLLNDIIEAEDIILDILLKYLK